MKQKKSDNIELQRRIRSVQDWILKDYFTTDIIESCIAKWGVSRAQAYRYLADANHEFGKVTEKNLEKRLYYHIQRRNKLLRDLDEKSKTSPAGIDAQLRILQDIADLEQLYKLKIQVEGVKGGAAIQTESTHKVIFEDYAK
jgi:hypothetical protein